MRALSLADHWAVCVCAGPEVGPAALIPGAADASGGVNTQTRAHARTHAQAARLARPLGPILCVAQGSLPAALLRLVVRRAGRKLAQTGGQIRVLLLLLLDDESEARGSRRASERAPAEEEEAINYLALCRSLTGAWQKIFHFTGRPLTCLLVLLLACSAGHFSPVVSHAHANIGQRQKFGRKTFGCQKSSAGRPAGQLTGALGTKAKRGQNDERQWEREKGEKCAKCLQLFAPNWRIYCPPPFMQSVD